MIAENDIHDVGNDRPQGAPFFGGIYFDAGCVGFDVCDNVVQRVVARDEPVLRWTRLGFWLMLQNSMNEVMDVLGNTIGALNSYEPPLPATADDSVGGR